MKSHVELGREVFQTFWTVEGLPALPPLVVVERFFQFEDPPTRATESVQKGVKFWKKKQKTPGLSKGSGPWLGAQLRRK